MHENSILLLAETLRLFAKSQTEHNEMIITTIDNMLHTMVVIDKRIDLVNERINTLEKTETK